MSMTHTQQSAALARKVADRWLKKGLTEAEFYDYVLGRQWSGDIKASDRVLWQQVEYALANMGPTDLIRQAEQLTTATGGR